MKKILSLVLALAMIMSCAVFASAAETEGDGTETNPWIIDSLPCTLTGTFGNEYGTGHFYQVTMTEPGEVSLESWTWQTCMVLCKVNGSMSEPPFTVAAGDIVTFQTWGNAPADYTISVGFTASESGEGGNGGEGGNVEQETFEGGELALGDNTLGVNAGEFFSPEYTFTPEEDGYLTLDLTTLTSIANDGVVTEWTPEEIIELVEGFNFYLQVDGVDYEGPVAVTAGTEYIITLAQSRRYSMYGWSCKATVNLSMGEAEAPAPEPFYEDEFTVETTDTYCYNELYRFTAPVTGTYEFFIPAGLGIITEEANDNWGAPIIDYYDNEAGYTFTLDMQEGDVFSFLTGAIVKQEWTITYTVTETVEGGEGGEGGDNVIPDGTVDLTIGTNDINGADITFVFTAPSAGNLVLNLGNAVMGPVSAEVTVNFANAQELNTESQITLELAEGDVVLVAFSASGWATMTAAWDGDPVEGGEDPVCEHEYVDGVCIYCGEEDPNYDPADPDGTEAHPFIIDELPAEFIQEITDDIFYKWIAPANGTLYVYFVDGLVGINGSSVGSWEIIEGGKYIEVAEGDVIIINVWSSTGFTVEFAPEGGEEPDPEALTGDANKDGKIDYLDAMLIAQFYVGDIAEDGLNVAAADVNRDGEVDYLDAMMVAQYYVGDIDSFEP